MNKFNDTRTLTLLLAIIGSLQAIGGPNWRIIGGLNSTFSSQTFNMEPVNMPVSDTLGNTHYLTASPIDTYPIMISDDNSYSERKTYSTKFSGLPFFGLQADISNEWIFRAKTIFDNNDVRIMDMSTTLYTPSNALDTNAPLLNQLPNSNETITITQTSHPEIAVSFLYNFSDYFKAGPIFTSAMQDYTLSLNHSTKLTKFSPITGDFGFETLFRLSNHLSLSTSIQASTQKSYIQRILNFSVTETATTSDDITTYTYALSYIPVDTSTDTPWQACSSYLINGSKCDDCKSTNETVTNYYYNASTPTIYGTTINIQDIDTTLGPQVWYNRYALRATVSLEWNYEVMNIIPKRLHNMTH